MRLPDVRTLSEYRTIYHRDELWRPAVDEVRRRHGLLEEPCVRGPDGTHIVYFSGRSHVVKLFCPLFARDIVAETLVAPRVAGRLGVATPAIVADGEVGGWRYLIMTRVPGRPLCEVWSRMSAADRLAATDRVGRTIVRLRRVPVEGLEPIAVDWKEFLTEQRKTAVARQGACDLGWDPSHEIPPYLDSVPEVFEGRFEPVLVLADITDEHVLVSDEGGALRVVSYVDFGDSIIGHPDYELVAPGLCIARGDADLLRTLLLASGFSESALDEGLGRRLMALTLMHRYVKLEDLTALVPAARRATCLEELARALWPVC
jgi:hygromycin-B 7''-O-kinase